jgi:hypothetical protein
LQAQLHVDVESARAKAGAAEAEAASLRTQLERVREGPTLIGHKRSTDSLNWHPARPLLSVRCAQSAKVWARSCGRYSPRRRRRRRAAYP